MDSTASKAKGTTEHKGGLSRHPRNRQGELAKAGSLRKDLESCKQRILQHRVARDRHSKQDEKQRGRLGTRVAPVVAQMIGWGSQRKLVRSRPINHQEWAEDAGTCESGVTS